MKNKPKQTDVAAPQSVTSFIKLKTNSESIQIGFTEQRVTPHGGLMSFAAFLQWHRLHELLKGWLPPGPSS